MVSGTERQPLLEAESLTNVERDPSCAAQEHDEANPLTWSNKYRWLLIGLLFLCTVIVSFTCMAILPVADDIVKDLEGHSDRLATVLFVTIWELGEAIGPLFLAPLSELYGRSLVYNVANCFLIVGIVVTALSPDVKVLILARFATGCAVAPNILNPAIIADLFPSESRGAPMSIIFMGPLLGAALGYVSLNLEAKKLLTLFTFSPTVGGALSEKIGWRSTVWICMAIATVFEILFITLFGETYYPVLLRRAAARKKMLSDADIRSMQHNVEEVADNDEEDESMSMKLKGSITRPIRIMWSSSMLQVMALWGGVVFVFAYVFYTSFPEILEVVYDFTPSERGISYLSSKGLGFIISIVICNLSMDKIYNALTARHKGFYPEGRLPIAITGGLLLPVTVTLYGWIAQQHLHISALLVMSTLQSISIVIAVVPLMTFITDTFGVYSASATTAILVPRNLFAALLPLLIPPLTESYGYGWGFTILAAFTLVLAPIPCLVMWYGPIWRQRSQYTRDP